MKKHAGLKLRTQKSSLFHKEVRYPNYKMTTDVQTDVRINEERIIAIGEDPKTRTCWEVFLTIYCIIEDLGPALQILRTAHRGSLGKVVNICKIKSKRNRSCN